MAASLVGLPQAAFGQQSRARRSRQAAKNIIFCVSDGMSWGVPSMFNQFLNLTEGKSSTWVTLLEADDAVLGTMDTRSLSGLVTDSAAASSSWGSGQHVWNGMINTYPDGKELTPVLRLLKDKAKMRTGLVTTSTITHATPAGWCISIDQRDKERQIAELYLKAGYDVYFGGGDKFFAGNEKQTDLYAEFARAGYGIAKNRSELSAIKEGKALGVFSSGHVPYEIDRLNQADITAKVPSLGEMTKKAIALLKGSSDGFILQVEGARIDHAAHNNDAAGLLYDQLAFEEAVKAVLEFARQDGETLVVVTSDHGNSNPGLVGSGNEYFSSTAGLRSLAHARASYDVLLPKINADTSLADAQDLIEANLGAKLSEDEATLALSGFKSTNPLKSIEQYNIPASTLSLALTNHTHVGWNGRQHTSDVTLVTAIGPGAEAFAGPIKNVDVFGKLLAHRGITHKNATMSYEDAARLLHKQAKQDLLAAEADHWL